VNRLSRATDAVGSGDLSYRISVQRRDQVGELQRSFNNMAEHLQELVAAAAEKERLERELEVARQLQQRLLPAQLLHTESVRFASFFEPSAAIGGDYYDLVRIDDHRLLVVIADVSGHGISAGLRMAMLKAALVTLLNEGFAAEDVLSRLDRMIRDERQGRFLVTATLALLDLRTGQLEITNAGHPPTYRIRGTAVDEVLLPSTALGALTQKYGSRSLSLEGEDLVVWLSDGLIEAMGRDGDVFGYDRLSQTLARGADSAHQLRDQLLSEVQAFTGGAPPEDDCTLLVLHYRPPTVVDSAPSENPSNE
jgi:sigma-B regulation protein RsbU (phosphoserine phosphatase)